MKTQNNKPEQQAEKRKPRRKRPLKATLMLSNDEGWEKPEKLSEEELAEIFAQLREQLVPELKSRKVSRKTCK